MLTDPKKIIILLSLLTATAVIAQEQEKYKRSWKEQFIDTTDNAFDVSTWMSQVYGFFPVVSIITEPATGFGAGLGVVHIHRKDKPSYKGGMIPPDLSAVGGLYTENGTWAAGLVHMGYWKRDRIRFRGVFAYFSANLAIYREGLLGNFREFGFNIQGPVFAPTVSFRIKSSQSFVGFQYVFLRTKVNFESPFENPPPVDESNLDALLSGLGVLYTWDSRDNTFTPNRGMYANATTMVYHEVLGSDLDYARIDAYWTGYTDVVKKAVLGLRFDYRIALNDPPFYSLPFVSLRGAPALRYQGKHVVVIETEERWDFSRRWSLTGFAGAGKGFRDFDNWSDSETAWSLGGGFRYFIARVFNLYGGIDVAKGPEQWAFYFQFGHYWNGL